MKSTKVITSAKVARLLLQNGFTIKDVAPNRTNKDRSIFVFHNSIELEDFLFKFENKDKE